MPHHQSRENGGCPRRHQDNAVKLSGVQQSERALGQPRRRNRAIDYGLPYLEAFGLQRLFQIEGDGLAGKVHERSATWIERVRNQS
jgi:hypothetical protein